MDLYSIFSSILRQFPNGHPVFVSRIMRACFPDMEESIPTYWWWDVVVVVALFPIRYLPLCRMQNIYWRRLWFRVDDLQGYPSEISDDATSVSVLIQKIIQIRDGRQIMAVGIHKTLCGGRNAGNLIEFTCFHLNISRVHVFCSNFSRIRKFCDDDHSKLVPESTWPGGFPSWTIVDNITKNSKVKI